MNRIGTLLDEKYFLISLLEEDELSKTYHIWHVEWEVPLTLKILKNSTPKMIKAAQEWIDLGIHPNIFAAYFYREIEGNCCLFLESTSGKKLSDLISRIREDFHETLRVLLEIAHGMAYLQEENRIYGNLHPDNIILDHYGRVKLHKIRCYNWEILEMLAKGMRPTINNHLWENLEKISIRQQAINKLHYQSPEYFLYKNYIPTLASDIYAYGMLAYKLIYGKMPYTVEDELENLWVAFRKRHLQKELIPLSESNLYSANLLCLIQSCLHPDPIERPKSFDEITSILQELYTARFEEEYVFENFPQNTLWAMSLNNQALGSIDEKKLSQAEQLLREVTALNSNSVVAPINYRLFKLRHRNTPLAEFLRRIQRYELLGDIRSYLLSSKICLEYGSLVSQIHQDISQIVIDDRVESIRGDLEYRLGYYQRAHAIYKTLASKNFGTNIWYRWGASAFSLKLTREVQLAWEKGLAQDLPLWDLTVGYSMFLATQGQWAKARQGLEEAAKNLGKYIRYSTNPETGGWSHVRLLLCNDNSTESPSSQMLYEVGISEDKRWIFARTQDGLNHIWEWPTGKKMPQIPLTVPSFIPKTANILNSATILEPRRISSQTFLTGAVQNSEVTATQVQVLSLNSKEIAASKTINTSPSIVANQTKRLISPKSGKIGIYLGEKKELQLWNQETKEIEKELSGHGEPILSAALTNDGKWAVSGSIDKTVRLWNLDTQTSVQVFNGHEDCVHYVNISENGQRVISASWDHSILVWDVSTNNFVARFPEYQHDITAIAISGDGILVANSNSNNQIKIWNTITKKLVAIVQGHLTEEKITCLAFSQDGQMLASGTSSGQVSIYEDINQRPCPLPTRAHYFLQTLPPPIPLAERQTKVQLEKEILEIDKPIFPKLFRDYESLINLQQKFSTPEIDLKFSQKLVQQAKQENWKSVECSRVQLIRTFIHDSSVIGFFLSMKKPEYFFSLSEKGTCLKWYLCDNHSEFFWHKFPCNVQLIDFCPVNNRFCFVSKDGAIHIWDTDDDQWSSIECHNPHIYSFKMTSDGKRAFVGTSDGMLQYWDLEEEYLIQEIAVYREMISQIEIIEDGRVVLAGLDGSISLWDGQSLQSIVLGQPKSKSILALKVVANYIISASSDGSLRQWNLNTNRCQNILKVSDSPITAIVLDSIGQFVLVGTKDGQLMLWDLSTCNIRKPIFNVPAHSKMIQQIFLTPDSQWAFSASEDATIKAWKLHWKWEEF